MNSSFEHCGAAGKNENCGSKDCAQRYSAWYDRSRHRTHPDDSPLRSKGTDKTNRLQLPNEDLDVKEPGDTWSDRQRVYEEIRF